MRCLQGLQTAQIPPHAVACSTSYAPLRPPPTRTQPQIYAHRSRATRTRRHAAPAATAPSVPQQDAYTVQPAATLQQLQQTARLRADAYYEEQPTTRFTDTFKRQFAEQELQSLRSRTGIDRPVAPHAQCVCLVALDALGNVQGCVDVRPPACHSGALPKGVTNDDTKGGYLLNVVVAEEHRRQGVGAQLVWAAGQHAVRALGAERLYTHVDAQNEVALRLYERCGFVQCDAVGGLEGTAVGRQLALVADLV